VHALQREALIRDLINTERPPRSDKRLHELDMRTNGSRFMLQPPSSTT
jgi:hypothetical protein